MKKPKIYPSHKINACIKKNRTELKRQRTYSEGAYQVLEHSVLKTFGADII